MTFAGLDKAARTDLLCVIHANAGRDGRVKPGASYDPKTCWFQRKVTLIPVTLTGGDEGWVEAARD